MNLELNNKVALVTGSSKGIGFAIAKMLYEEGCNVVLNGRDPDVLEKAVSMLPGASGIVADVTRPEEAERLVADVVNQFGHLDGLVCNVGSGRSVSPGNENLEEWQRVFSVNLWTTTNMVEASTEALAAREGAIVCISSICGNEVIPEAPITYSVAKAALNAYVRGISRPLGRRGVRITAIAPGNIFFNGSVWAQKMKKNQAIVEEMLTREVALNKFGTPDDIAYMAAFLLSPNSKFATGAVCTLDGGQVHS